LSALALLMFPPKLSSHIYPPLAAALLAPAGAPPSPAVTRPAKQQRRNENDTQAMLPPANKATQHQQAGGDKGYSQLCASAEQLFDGIRRHLAHDVLPLALHTGLLAPCREQCASPLNLHPPTPSLGQFEWTMQARTRRHSRAVGGAFLWYRPGFCQCRFRIGYICLGMGYNRVEGNRRASRNGVVSDLPPEILTLTISQLLHRCRLPEALSLELFACSDHSFQVRTR
jgi:hypothetical protein